VSLESVPEHAAVARANVERAGLDAVIEVRVGPALETLPRLEDDDPAPFDLISVTPTIRTGRCASAGPGL
jgi:predicted O-methyltransferase YrrM